jgi:hypothetical protein
LVRRPLAGLLYRPWMTIGESVQSGGMRIGRGNQSTRRKAAPVSLRPPRPNLRPNPDRRDGKPVSYGTANLRPVSVLAEDSRGGPAIGPVTLPELGHHERQLLLTDGFINNTEMALT